MSDDIRPIEPEDAGRFEAVPDRITGFFSQVRGDDGDHDGEDFRDDRADGEDAPVENENFAPLVYYDPARFAHPDDLENLEGLIRSRRPAGELRQWRPVALTADMLRGWSPFTTARAERRFVARGYSTELECRDDVMREGGQTDQHHAALDALHHATVVAEIVIESVQNIMGDACPAWLREDAETILGPVLGRMSFAIGNGRVTVREVPLVETGGLLKGCRNFDCVSACKLDPLIGVIGVQN